MIGGDADMGRAMADHAEQRVQHATHGRDFAAVAIPRRRHRVIVAKELVGAVDQMDVHREGCGLPACGIEVLLQLRAVGAVTTLELFGGGCLRRDPLHEAGFEHERHGPLELTGSSSAVLAARRPRRPGRAAACSCAG